MSEYATTIQGVTGRPRPSARLIGVLLAGLSFHFHFQTACEAAEVAATAPALDPALGRLLSDYLADPKANRAAVLDLQERGVETLPAAGLLALADAYLRSGSTSRATSLLREVVARDVGPPWAGWAEYGLGWVALSSGDLAAARSYLERARAAEWNTPSVATLIGLVDAAEGRGIDAARELAERASDPSATTTMIQVARLGVAYAYYWSGEFPMARRVFSNVAREYPNGPFADDARYAAAWSAWRAGDREGAVSGLQAAAGRGRQPVRGMRVSRDLLNLEVRAVLGDGLRRYRRGRYSMQAVDGQIADLLNLDGGGLARAALVRLGEPASEAGAEPAPAIGVPTTEEAGRLGSAQLDTPEARREVRPTGPSAPVDALHGNAENPGAGDRPRRLRVLLVMLAIAAVALGWLWRRPQSKGGVDALRAGRHATKQEAWRS